MHKFILPLLIVGLFIGCETKKTSEKKGEELVKKTEVPRFNGDSAYAFIQTQVNFGPRIPNTVAHIKTAEYLVQQLKKYGALVTEQNFTAPTFDGKSLKLKNIIASFYPEKAKRILLGAHWDTRPFADKDKEKPNVVFDGANDGASGVAVLLEVARHLGNSKELQFGVDIILFDGEDWGELDHASGQIPPAAGLDSWWCLGSQHWSKNKHKNNYTAYYGILLDMVGGKNARFFREGISQQYANDIVDKVWSTAGELGYSHVFVQASQGSVTDDHYYVNAFAKIPMIDVINYDPSLQNFGSFHHTQKDNMDIISKETLAVVGNTLLHVIYKEN